MCSGSFVKKVGFRGGSRGRFAVLLRAGGICFWLRVRVRILRKLLVGVANSSGKIAKTCFGIVSGFPESASCLGCGYEFWENYFAISCCPPIIPLHSPTHSGLGPASQEQGSAAKGEEARGQPARSECQQQKAMSDYAREPNSRIAQLQDSESMQQGSQAAG